MTGHQITTPPNNPVMQTLAGLARLYHEMLTPLLDPLISHALIDEITIAACLLTIGLLMIGTAAFLSSLSLRLFNRIKGRIPTTLEGKP